MSDFKKQIQKLMDKIIHYEHIAIFPHVSPDPDALGAAFGLKEWISANYPEKKVCVLSDKEHDFLRIFPPIDEIPENIGSYLGIVVDTGVLSRVGSSVVSKAKELLCIDHHPYPENFGTLNIVNVRFVAASELIAKIIFQSRRTSRDISISKKTLEYLFCGIVTDTGRFLHGPLTGNTFRTVAQIIDSRINFRNVYKLIYERKPEEIAFQAHCLKKIKIEKPTAYLIIEEDTAKDFKVSFEKAKSYVSLMNNFNGVETWLLAVYNYELNVWNLSLRSKSKPVNKIAQKYGGGGHTNAAGVKIQDKNLINKIIFDLKKL